MNLDFALTNVVLTEFGVGRDDAGVESFVLVPVDDDVQAALGEMTMETVAALDDLSDDPAVYEPSEKYSGNEYVRLPLANVLAEQIRLIHTADNLPLNAGALADPMHIFCYFVRLSDNQGKRLTAIRRSVQFKGVLKSRLIRLVTDSMKLVTETVFKLDKDFDLLVDNGTIHALRPTALEALGKLQAAVLDAVVENVEAIAIDLPFVNFDTIMAYASGHSRAARSVAALRGKANLAGVDRAALCAACAKTGVNVIELGNQISVASADVVAFLEVLDRRRYQVDLVLNAPESYRASSRSKL